MTDALVATAIVVLLVSAGLALLAGVTVVPFVVAVERGEALGASPARVGALAAAGCAAGVLLSVLYALNDSAAGAAAALPLLLAWVVPAVLRALDAAPGWLGRAGRHEPAGGEHVAGRH